jgi:hypothetical protein
MKLKLVPVLSSIVAMASAAEWKNISDPVTAEVKPGYAT